MTSPAPISLVEILGRKFIFSTFPGQTVTTNPMEHWFTGVFDGLLSHPPGFRSCFLLKKGMTDQTLISLAEIG